MSIDNLQDLMLHELQDLLSAEHQLLKALPKMASSATSPELQTAFLTHLEQTKEHVARLEKVFGMLDAPAKQQKCKGMAGLIEEGEGLMEEEIDPEVLDAGLIAAAQRVEHYEIAVYGSLCEFARSLGHKDVQAVLEETLAEEKATDLLLTQLAEGGVNALAGRN